MNETAINNAIRELEEMTDLLRKILERKITQKQAADKLGNYSSGFPDRIKEQFFQLYQEKKYYHRRSSTQMSGRNRDSM